MNFLSTRLSVVAVRKCRVGSPLIEGHRHTCAGNELLNFLETYTKYVFSMTFLVPQLPAVFACSWIGPSHYTCAHFLCSFGPNLSKMKASNKESHPSRGTPRTMDELCVWWLKSHLFFSSQVACGRNINTVVTLRNISYGKGKNKIIFKYTV